MIISNLLLKNVPFVFVSLKNLMHSQLAFRYTAQRSIRFCFKTNFCHVLILSIEIEKREEKMEDRRLVNSFHSHTPACPDLL